MQTFLQQKLECSMMLQGNKMQSSGSNGFFSLVAKLKHCGGKAHVDSMCNVLRLVLVTQRYEECPSVQLQRLWLQKIQYKDQIIMF